MIKLMTTLFAIYALIIAGMAVGQRKLMYFPNKDMLTAAEYGLSKVESSTLKTSDNELLAYWYLPAADTQPTILYFHGNGGNLSFRTEFFNAAAKRGYGVLMVSYRGYGTSTGSPTEPGLYEDARTVYNHVSQQLKIPDDQLIIYGESLGTGVATELARGKNIKALVLQAPYISILKIAQDRYWWLPVSLVMKDRYETINKLGDIIAPTLLLAAENDRITPAVHAKQLHDLLTVRKKLITFENIGHGGFDWDATLDALGDFNDH